MSEIQNKNFDIEKRKPIWIALSSFYLDNQLQDYEFENFAKKIKESPYSLEEVKQIDKEEVFPVLYSNLLYLVGVWSGFEEEWLLKEIIKKLHKRNRFNSFILRIKYARLKWMYKDYWEKLEKVFQEL
ncbi:MAG: hypothetical protein AB8B59_04630 [Maribacter sp.]